MLGFLGFSGVIIALGEANRQLFNKQQQSEEALRSANGRLEDRVKKRTAELERSNEAARRLSAKVIAVQDEERRRIGRSLHDSLGQYLAALKIALDVMKVDRQDQRNAVSDCSELVERCLTETRTISHLLHPPLLDERGFCSATRSFVEGFSRRSGLVVTLDLPATSVRMSANLEIALFRAVQEGLTNIHRYAKATCAGISFTANESSVRLVISDNGRGMPPLLLDQIRDGTADTGVGIAGMRERVRELNGALEIQSSNSGTILTITTGSSNLQVPQSLTIAAS
jgi:signal transduction histidine kinase